MKLEYIMYMYIIFVSGHSKACRHGVAAPTNGREISITSPEWRVRTFLSSFGRRGVFLFLVGRERAAIIGHFNQEVYIYLFPSFLSGTL